MKCLLDLSIFSFLFPFFISNTVMSPSRIWRLADLEHPFGECNFEAWGTPKDTIFRGEGMTIFSGRGDGFLVGCNPIDGLSEFTIELEFVVAGDDDFLKFREQRIIHIQDPLNSDRRILLELRLKNENEWYGDWFMKNEQEGLTLIDSTLTHPTNTVCTMSLVYSDGNMFGFINGEKELEGKIEFQPIGSSGRTSVGVRMNKISWFRGLIKEIRFYPFPKYLKDK